MQMKGTRKFSDVAKEALERPLSDKFENGVSHVDVKKILEYIVKKVDYKWRFECLQIRDYNTFGWFSFLHTRLRASFRRTN